MAKGRSVVQGIFTVLTNSYFAGFLNGTIYRGPLKQACLPGLSCYSCPGALGSCPVGALQAVAGDKQTNLPLYTGGFLIALGAISGRLVCGWLCPFGWFQELLHRIPIGRKNPRIPGDRLLRALKYAILAVFVLLLPMAVTNAIGYGDPWFCKYICPSGTLMAGWPLFIANAGIRGAVGGLFTWKTLILAAVILASIPVSRPFCKWLCPLGAVYGLFNRFSLYRHDWEEALCVHCGNCKDACPMGIDPAKTPNSPECIRCGDCLAACASGALGDILPKTLGVRPKTLKSNGTQ